MKSARIRLGRGYSNYINPVSRIPTYHFQQSLPRLPIPKLEDTLRKYEGYVEPILSEADFAATKNVIKEFASKDGPKLHEKLVQQDQQNKHTSFISKMWYDMYLEGRYPLLINSNPFIEIKKPDSSPHSSNQVARTSSLIVSSLKWLRSLKDEVLAPEVFHTKGEFTPLFENLVRFVPSSLSYYPAYFRGSYPLDMSQYSKLFATTRIPLLGRDELKSFPDSKHIVIMRKGHFFALDVLNEDGSAKSATEIQSGVKAIVEAPLNKASDDAALGLATSEDRNVWAELRSEIITDTTNRNSLEMIDSALFVICIDEKAPSGHEETCKNFLYGDTRNRWFDKSFSTIVTSNGQAAVNFEHSWGDGVAVLRYIKDIYKDTRESHVIPQSNVAPAIPRPLAWNFSPKAKQMLRNAATKVDTFTNSLELKVAIFDKFGKDFFKSRKVSGDGAIQMAYQLAYNKMYGKTVSTYESASTAGFLHGRTEVVRPASNKSVQLVKVMNSKASNAEKESALRAAVEVHSALVKDAVTGKGADRHLFALYNLAKQQGNVPLLFADKAYGLLNHNILSTSTLSDEAIEGGGFGPVVANGYGIGYDASSNKIRFCVTSYKLQTDKFINLIQESLVDIQKVLEQK